MNKNLLQTLSTIGNVNELLHYIDDIVEEIRQDNPHNENIQAAAQEWGEIRKEYENEISESYTI